MEPVEWIVGLVFLIGGYELWGKEEPKEPVVVEVVQEQSIISDVPVFERGRYYKAVEGYYISNLTPPPKKIEGCDRSVLMADLTAPRNDEGAIRVTEVDIECEG